MCSSDLKGKATNPLEIQKTIEFILNHRTHDETDINHAEKLITTYPEYIKVKEAHNNSPEISLLLEQFKQVYANALSHLSNAQNNLLKYEFEACFSGIIPVDHVQQLMEKIINESNLTKTYIETLDPSEFTYYFKLTTQFYHLNDQEPITISNLQNISQKYNKNHLKKIGSAHA